MGGHATVSPILFDELFKVQATHLLLLLLLILRVRFTIDLLDFLHHVGALIFHGGVLWPLIGIFDSVYIVRLKHLVSEAHEIIQIHLEKQATMTLVLPMVRLKDLHY
jgi:hypothetical protein